MAGDFDHGAHRLSDAADSDDQFRITFEEFAHEINSLLDGSLRTVSQMLLDPGRSPAEQEHAITTPLGNLQAALERMAALTKQALANRPGPLVIPFDRRSIGEIVAVIVHALEPLATAHGVGVSTMIEPGAGDCSIGRLGPAVQNGLKNAIDAAAVGANPAPHVELSVTSSRGLLHITIVDSGPGVDPDQVEHADRAAGHGIGLGLTTRLVEQSGGNVRLKNVPFGRGAIFEITIPIRNLVAA